MMVLLLTLACSSDNQDNLECDFENPFEKLEWLNDIKESFEIRMSIAGAQIIQYNYQGEIVFLIDDCYQCADGMTQVYNCQGDVICEFGGILGRNTCPDFHETATDRKMLFNNVQN